MEWKSSEEAVKGKKGSKGSRPKRSALLNKSVIESGSSDDDLCPGMYKTVARKEKKHEHLEHRRKRPLLDNSESTERIKAGMSKDEMDIKEHFGHEFSSSTSDSDKISNSDWLSSRNENRNEVVKDKKVEASRAEHLHRICYSRSMLAKIVHAPFFAKAVIGCFVRMNVGGRARDRGTYMVSKIVGVVETAKVYQLEDTLTNKGFEFEDDRRGHSYRLEYVSNSKITESEASVYFDGMRSEDMPIITMDVVEKKEKLIKEAMNHTYTDAEFEKTLKEKARFNKVTINYTVEKLKLLGSKEMALASGRHEDAVQVQRQIEEIEERAAKMHRQLSGSTVNIGSINQRNRQSLTDAILSGAVVADISNQNSPFTRKKLRMKPRCAADKQTASLKTPTAYEGDARREQPSLNNADQSKLKIPANVERGESGDQSKQKTSKKVLREPPVDHPEQKTPPNKKNRSPIEHPVFDLFEAHNFHIGIDIPISSSIPYALYLPAVRGLYRDYRSVDRSKKVSSSSSRTRYPSLEAYLDRRRRYHQKKK